MEIYACGFNGYQQIDVLQKSRQCKAGDQRGDNSVCCISPVKVLEVDDAATRIRTLINWTQINLFLKSDNQNLEAGAAQVNVHSNEEELAETKCDVDFVACTWSISMLGGCHGDVFVKKHDNSHWIKARVEPDVKIRHASGGEKCFFIVYDNDKVGKLEADSKGKEENTSNYSLKLEPVFLGLHVASVRCGKEHTLLLTKCGSLFSFGLGSRGQLGHGTVDEEKTPRLVEALEGLPIVAIATGGWHSAAVAGTGDLYMWGWNESSQLGFPCATMVVKDGDLGENSEQYNHRLFCTGWNKYGQLCLGDTQSRDRFCEVKLLCDKKIQDVACGYWTTVIITMVTKDMSKIS